METKGIPYNRIPYNSTSRQWYNRIPYKVLPLFLYSEQTSRKESGSNEEKQQYNIKVPETFCQKVFMQVIPRLTMQASKYAGKRSWPGVESKTKGIIGPIK